MKRLLPLGLLFLVYCLGLAVGPRVAPEDQVRYCVKNVTFVRPLGLSMNCDSFNFLENAARPSLLLGERSIHQGRPLQIVAASVLGYPLQIVLRPVVERLNLQDNMAFGVDVVGKENQYRATTITSEDEAFNLAESFVPYFAAYFLLNVLLLGAVLWLGLQLMMGEQWTGFGRIPLAVVAVAGVLLVNDVTKSFLLSPHSQIFNIVVPVYALFTLMTVQRDPSAKTVVSLSLIAGISTLAYAYFFIVLPCVLLGLWFSRRQSPAPASRLIGRALASAVLILLPSVAWYAYVVSVNGQFYSFEIDCCQQIVWIGTAWEQGPLVLLRTSFDKLTFFAYRFLLAGYMAVPWLLVTAVAWLGANRPTLKINRYGRQLIGSAAVVSALSIAFFSVLGYTVSRLAFGSAVPLVIVAGWLIFSLGRALTAQQQWRLSAISFLTLVAWAVYVVVKAMPRPWV